MERKESIFEDYCSNKLPSVLDILEYIQELDGRYKSEIEELKAEIEILKQSVK